MLKMQDGRPVIVREPVMRPNQCALNTHVTRDPDGFIDTGTKLPGFAPRVYVAMSSLRELVRSLGWPTPEEHEAALERHVELQDEIVRVSTELAAAQRKLDAIEALESEGFRARKRPGRPPKAQVAA